MERNEIIMMMNRLSPKSDHELQICPGNINAL